MTRNKDRSFIRTEIVIPLLFFIIYFIYGLFVFDDYAVFPDEESERITACLPWIVGHMKTTYPTMAPSAICTSAFPI